MDWRAMLELVDADDPRWDDLSRMAHGEPERA
jgi:hypothetical protein